MDLKTEIISWQEAKKLAPSCNPSFVKIVDSISNSSDVKLIKAQYPYMTPLLSKGVFNLFINNKTKDSQDKSVDPEIRKLLNYTWRAIPPGITTKGSIEPQTHTFSHSIPFGIFLPGAVFATVGVLDTKIPGHYIPSAYSLVAGCESILILPPISDKQKNDALHKKFQISEKIYPHTFSEQTALIKQIVHSEKFETPWYSEAVFFSKDLFSEKNDVFLDKLSRFAWNRNLYVRYQYLYQMLWAVFIEKFVQPKVGSLYKRSAAHIVSIVKHLVEISMGHVSAFVPAVDDTTAPVSALIDAYLDVYNSRFFHPTIMTISPYTQKAPVYYSLHRHTFFNPAPELTKPLNTIEELTLIRDILELFCDAVLTHDPQLELELKNTILYNTLENTKFSFYHPQAKKGSGINSDIESLFEEDKRFSQVHRVKSEKHLKPPITSSFFKGCIRIKPRSLRD